MLICSGNTNQLLGGVINLRTYVTFSKPLFEENDFWEEELEIKSAERNKIDRKTKENLLSRMFRLYTKQRPVNICLHDHDDTNSIIARGVI